MPSPGPRQPSSPTSEPPPDPTRSLLDAARAGDAESFGRLYEEVAPAVHAWAELRLRPAQRALLDPGDLVQEVWLRAWRGLAGLDLDAVPFRPWVFRIAKNVLLEALRRSQAAGPGTPGPTTRLFALANVPDSVTAVSRRLVRDEGLAAFTEEVRSLPPDDRKLVTHCGLEGLTYAEVGSRLGLTTDAVAKRWQRLRSRLEERGLPALLATEPPA